MAFINPSYLTIQEWRDNTRIDETNYNDDEITPALIEAEWIIDGEVHGVVPADKTQDRAFPTLDKEGNSVMPVEVKQATVYLVDNILLNGAPSVGQGGDLKSERWSGNGGYSVSYEQDSNPDSRKVTSLPSMCRKLLKNWLGGYPLTY